MYLLKTYNIIEIETGLHAKCMKKEINEKVLAYHVVVNKFYNNKQSDIYEISRFVFYFVSDFSVL